MLGKLAVRNTKRSLKDYLIYLITITISFSLILAYNLVASSNEVVELSSGMETFKTILTFVNVIIIFVVCFLINYTTRFMFEKRSKELGTYMLLGIKKKVIARLLVSENILLGIFAFILSIPLGFIFSQFVSLVIVKLLGIPEVIFISMNFASIELLAIYFLVIYVLVLLNLLRRIKKMTVHDFLYFDKLNEKKMFHSSKIRNIIFVISAIIGVVSLLLWNSQLEKQQKRLQQEIEKIVQSKAVMERHIHAYDEDEKWQLPEPAALMSAKAYKDKKAFPLVEKLKETIKALTIKCVQLAEQGKKLKEKVTRQEQQISRLTDKVMEQSDIIDRLQEKAADLGRLERYFGREQVQSIVERSKALEWAEKANKRLKRVFDMSR